jgi:glutaredoxin 2
MNSENTYSDSPNIDKIKKVLTNLVSEKFLQSKLECIQIHYLLKTLDDQDYTVKVEKLLTILQEFISSAEYEEFLKQVTIESYSFTDRLNQSPDTLEEICTELVQSLDQILQDDEQQQRKQSQQDYSEAAKAAIARSLSNVKLASHNLRGLLADFNKQLETIQQNNFD